MSFSQFKHTGQCAFLVFFDCYKVSEHIHFVLLTSGTKDQANCITALSRPSGELFIKDFLDACREVLSPGGINP